MKNDFMSVCQVLPVYIRNVYSDSKINFFSRTNKKKKKYMNFLTFFFSSLPTLLLLYSIDTHKKKA